MRKVNKAQYQEQPDRYELRSGSAADAPACPYGNRYEWVGYDLVQQEYVRFTKRLFKQIIQTMKNNKVNLSLQVIPINTADTYPMIDEAIRVIQKSGVKHEVQPFSTIMEGELEELLALVLEAKKAVLEAGAEELVLNIQVHLKKDKDVTFEEKTAKFKG